MNFFPNLIPILPSNRANNLSPVITSPGYSQAVSAHSKTDDCSQVAVKEILFQVSSSGKWLYLDENWEALAGLNAGTCMGRSFVNYFDYSDRGSLSSLLKEVIAGQRQSFQFSTHLLRRNKIPLNAKIIACRFLNEHRNTIGITGTIQIQDFEYKTQQDLKQFIQSLPIAAGILEIRGNNLTYYFTGRKGEMAPMDRLRHI